MVRIWFDFPQDDRESVEQRVEVIPRIGENVGITPIEGQRESIRRLDVVLDVRHYFAVEPEIRVLLGTP